MKSLRFAFSGRWLGYLAFAVVFAIACGFLANWQLARSHEAAAANALVEKNFDSQTVPLTSALPHLDSYRSDQQWLRVTVRGTYEEGKQLLVRNRPTDAGPGFEVLTPLRLADGSLFIVDRGWVGMANSGTGPAHISPAPTGEVTVIARLKASEPSIPGRTHTGRQIGTIQLPLVAKLLDEPVYTGAYGLLQSQTPPAAHSLTPVVTAPPMKDEGLHWSYMIQWIIFALIGFFGLGYAIRQEYKIRRSRDSSPEDRPAAPPRPTKRRRKTDAEIEDELLEQMGH